MTLIASCECNGHGTCQTIENLYQSYTPVLNTRTYTLWDRNHTSSCVCDYGKIYVLYS